MIPQFFISNNDINVKGFININIKQLVCRGVNNEALRFNR
jgi:hypothetical protein